MSLVTDRPPERDSGVARRARQLLRYEADVAFRRRACTVLQYLDPQPSDRILDDGCGLGFYLHLLARLTKSTVWGVDRDEDRLATAAADAYAAQTRRLRADVTKLPFRAAAFDKVISSEVLEHLDDDTAAMQEVARVLKPRGVCAITVPNADYPALWDPINYLREGLGLGHFSKGPLTGIWTDHRRLYSSRQIVDLVEGVGLSVTDVRLETRHAFPFSHNLIYVVGKAVIESGVLGLSSRQRSDLWTDDPRWTPARALASIFAWPDRFNRDAYPGGPAVSLCVRAVK